MQSTSKTPKTAAAPPACAKTAQERDFVATEAKAWEMNYTDPRISLQALPGWRNEKLKKLRRLIALLQTTYTRERADQKNYAKRFARKYPRQHDPKWVEEMRQAGKENIERTVQRLYA
jgi:hypothetical protein